MSDKEKVVVDLDSSNWGSEDFTLTYPFKFRGMTYEKLMIRTPNGSDIDRWVKTGEGSFRSLAENLTETPGDVFDRMHGLDYSRLMATVGAPIKGDN